MERLTTDRDYEIDKGAYDRHLAQGYPRNMARERFLKLCEYERTGHTPEEIAEFDRIYLEKCQEVNRLIAELTELKKQPQGDLISRSALIEQLRKEGNLPYLVKGAIDNAPTAYDVNCVLDALERKSFEAAGFSVIERKVAVDIVRKGGKE